MPFWRAIVSDEAENHKWRDFKRTERNEADADAVSSDLVFLLCALRNNTKTTPRVLQTQHISPDALFCTMNLVFISVSALHPAAGLSDLFKSHPDI